MKSLRYPIALLLVSCSLIFSQSAAFSSPPAAPKKPTPKADPLESYMQTIDKKIGKVWKHLELDKQARAVVHFEIGPNGAVETASIKESSGDETADQYALSAVKDAAPYLPPPNKEKKLAIDYGFAYHSKSEKVDLKPYTSRLGERIRRVWHPPKTLKKTQVEVTFHIAKGGDLIDVIVKRSSGEKTLDDAAVNAIKRAGPFDPLPAGAGERFTMGYIFNCGPAHSPDDFKWNGMALSDASYKVSRSGATLSPMDTESKVEHQLQEREWALKEKMISLSRTLEEAEKKGDGEKSLVASLSRQLADCCSQLKDFSKAESHYKKAIEIDEQQSDQKELSLALSGLAAMYANQGKLSDAEPLYARLTKMENLSSSNPGQYKATLEQYAKLLYKLNRVAEANAVYKLLKQ